MVFKKLREHELYLREEKCELFTAKVNCLGHMVDEKGLHVDTNKMAKICDWNRPCNFKDVQRFFRPHTISGTLFTRYNIIHWPIGEYDNEWNTILLEAST